MSDQQTEVILALYALWAHSLLVTWNQKRYEVTFESAQARSSSFPPRYWLCSLVYKELYEGITPGAFLQVSILHHQGLSSLVPYINTWTSNAQDTQQKGILDYLYFYIWMYWCNNLLCTALGRMAKHAPPRKKESPKEQKTPPPKNQSRFFTDAVMQGKIFGNAKLGKHDITNVMQSTSFKTSTKSTHLTGRI